MNCFHKKEQTWNGFSIEFIFVSNIKNIVSYNLGDFKKKATFYFLIKEYSTSFLL